jgi:hypothetical protein
VAEQKLNLFEFASTTVAEADASATKIVGCQIGYAGLTGTPLQRIPDYVACHASLDDYPKIYQPLAQRFATMLTPPSEVLSEA